MPDDFDFRDEAEDDLEEEETEEDELKESGMHIEDGDDAVAGEVGEE